MQTKDDKYTDGFLVPVRKDKLDDYRRVSERCAEVWKEFGALEYVETVIDHDNIPEMRAFAAAADAKDDEIVVLAYVVFPSKEVRDAANEKIMEDPRVADICSGVPDIFDYKRMAYGGFRTLVRA